MGRAKAKPIEFCGRHDGFRKGSTHPTQGHRASVTIKSIAGIDHAVVVVKDLDAAAANWKQLGFTISPRGTHSAHMGTGNYTIMLGEDYMELLGVLNATEHNAPARAFLDKRGEGIERIAFTAVDSAA